MKLVVDVQTPEAVFYYAWLSIIANIRTELLASAYGDTYHVNNK